MTICSDFPSNTMLWIKEVEMVDSLEELKSSREDRLCSEQDHPEFPVQEEGQSRVTESSEKRTEEDRSLS